MFGSESGIRDEKMVGSGTLVTKVFYYFTHNFLIALQDLSWGKIL
jgi:hypothetical protein